MKIALFLMFSTTVSSIFGELYSSIAELESLIENDEKLVDALRQLLEELENEMSKVKRF